MGYRKIDPRTKAAAIKAMRKAVEDNGRSPYSAARELSIKYRMGTNTLHKYFTEVRAAAEPESEVVEYDDGNVPAAIGAAEIVVHDHAARHLDSADRLSAEFTGALEKLSTEFVVHLQEAALDDLIRRMRELRDGLRH